LDSPFTVTLINPAGFAGRVAEPAVAVVLLVKFRRFKKNNCHARVGRPDWSDKGDVGIL
jgi:hypothetical protein